MDKSPTALRLPLARATALHAAFDGWTLTAARRAAADLGLAPRLADLAFPAGPAQIVSCFIAAADEDMALALEDADLPGMKLRDRIRRIIRTRLELHAAAKEAVRRALAVHLLPGSARAAAKSLAGTVDAMWRLAGDTSTDFAFYTKRATLAAVYSSTLLVWLNDKSEDHEDTWAFLDRRIEDVMRIEKAKAKMRGRKLPDMAGWLGRVRYGLVVGGEH